MADAAARIEDGPAFHRHVLVTPEQGCVSAWVEDDYHHMGVALRHEGGRIVAVEAEMVRAPWTTCPGAAGQLRETFEGASIDRAAAMGDKKRNCTHLHDMATLAASHAGDSAAIRYEIRVTDAENGRRLAELRIAGDNTASAMRWIEQDGRLVEPAEAAGNTLFELGGWIASLAPPEREKAKLLRWAAIIAHGRRIPLEDQSDATRMPPNCYSFQPGRKEKAVRVGKIIDFAETSNRPLDAV